MSSFNRLVTVLPLLLSFGHAANIFVSHYTGTITNLNFDLESNGTYSLSTNNSIKIGGQPSWMTWDASSRTIYASDESGFGSASITAVSAATNGGLSQLAKATAPLGAVANVLYGNGGYIASAH
jgi:hypothetical protein